MEEKIKKFLSILDKEIEQTKRKFNISGIKVFDQKVKTLYVIKQEFESFLKAETPNSAKLFAIFVRSLIKSISQNNNNLNLNLDNNEKLWLISEIINLNVPLIMKNEQEDKEVSDRVEKLLTMYNEKGEE